MFERALESWDIILFDRRNFEIFGYHAVNLWTKKLICEFSKKWTFSIQNCVESPEHVRSDFILHIIRFWVPRTQKQTLYMIFRPISSDFDFWKFWPTNENFEIFEISTFSESGSKSRMMTSDGALESLNIIFFDLQILGTTLVPSGWPTCTWNKPKTSIFGKPTNDFFRSQNYLMVPKNFEISMIKKYDVSAFQNRVDCFHTTSRSFFTNL